MENLFINDSIDLSEYLETKMKTQVRSAGSYAEELISKFYGEDSKSGMVMPWSKADGLVFRPAEMTIWTGYKGHGKSAFLSNVLLHGMQNSERILIISPEFTAVQVLMRKVRQASGSGEPSESYINGFCKWASGRLWLFDHRGAVNTETVLAVIRYAIDKHKITQVLIDSLMKCGMSPDQYDAQKSFVDALQTISHDNGIHIHLVAHSRKKDDDSKPAELHDVKGTSEICDMAENVVSVWKNKKKILAQSIGDKAKDEEPDCVLLCDSQRNGDWTGKLTFWFDHASMQFLEFKNARPSYIDV